MRLRKVHLNSEKIMPQNSGNITNQQSADNVDRCSKTQMDINNDDLTLSLDRVA